MSLDYAYDDWCVAQIARRLNHPDVADALMARAQNYRLWDPTVGFMRGKKEDGSWDEPFDEFEWQGPYADRVPGRRVGLFRMIPPVWPAWWVAGISSPRSWTSSSASPSLRAIKLASTKRPRWPPSPSAVCTRHSPPSTFPISTLPSASRGRLSTGPAAPAPNS